MITIEKPWGKEEILELNKDYVVKRLTMKAGHRCSLQYHRSKRETIYVLFGTLVVDNGGADRQVYLPGANFTVEPMQIHRMAAGAPFDVVYLECSTNHLDDIVRVEDEYGRITC